MTDPAHTRRVIAIASALKARSDAEMQRAHVMARHAYPDLAAANPCACPACTRGDSPEWGRG